MNTTQTAAAQSTTIDEVAEIAKAISEANAFEYPGNYGRGAFRFAIAVSLSGGIVSLHAKVNACISRDRARQEMRTVWSALVAELQARGIASAFSMPKHRGSVLWQTGDWHMGRFHQDGIKRQLRAK